MSDRILLGLGILLVLGMVNTFQSGIYSEHLFHLNVIKVVPLLLIK